jgi:diguanylate cyclase (GGDEF)-like protein/PAS domain S-box-containing protein
MRLTSKTCPVFFSLILACLLSIDGAFTSRASAQFGDPGVRNPDGFGGDNGPGRRIVTFVERLDRDGDGRVSREEFDGPPDRFDIFDRNHDGYLTEDERPPLPPTGNRPTAPQQNVQVSPAVTPEVKQRLDSVSETRSSGDAGGDSGTGGARVTFVERLDRDGDGRVSREEFDGPPDQFDILDRNNDGYLSEDERPSLPPLVNNTPVQPQDPQVNPVATPEVPTRHPWLNVFSISAFAALLLALAWGAHASRRFRKVRKALESLDPHLLAVNIDSNIMITEVTEALCKATGFKFKDLVGKPLMALGSHVADNPNAMQDIWNKIQMGSAWKGEVKLIRRNGSVLWADAVISPSRRKKDKSSGYTVFYQDISKRKHFESLSMRDELTGLFNRRYFNEVAPLLLQKARRERHIYVLCIMDVDNFKAYNDTYGHPAGDMVLASIGRQLTAIFQRRDDMLFRLGGEEFGIIYIVNDEKDAVTKADKTLGAIRELKIKHEKNPPGIVTVSIGLRIVKADDSDDVESIYKKADHALYEAKQAGRDRFTAAKS